MGVSVSLRTRWKEWQADRALPDLDLSSCRKHGIQGEHSPMAGTPADWGLRFILRIVGGPQTRLSTAIGNPHTVEWFPILCKRIASRGTKIRYCRCQRLGIGTVTGLRIRKRIPAMGTPAADWRLKNSAPIQKSAVIPISKPAAKR
jgi:hypothetical protein